LTVSAIARELGVDRKTVRKCIARGLEPPVYGPRAGCGVPFQLKEREPKEIDADVVEERGEPFLLPLPCCLSYAFQRT
jgi:hypothetical protein